jgi:hypothetical protein
MRFKKTTFIKLQSRGEKQCIKKTKDIIIIKKEIKMNDSTIIMICKFIHVSTVLVNGFALLLLLLLLI